MARSSRDPAAIAVTRERFLAADVIADRAVRRLILTSWERSQEHNVARDQVAVPYMRAPDLETPLARSAAPILDSLHEQLSGDPVSIILTDQAGLVIDRRSASPAIATSLDAVHLAPGFSYAEEHAGTNGIGTALSTARPTLVDGREHYTGELGRFCCAGAPIHHPTHHRVIGVLDLTTYAQTSGAMLMALARATARQIEDEILAQTGLREFALFQEYMTACRSGGAVLALNNDVVMMNDHLRQLIDANDQQALIGYAADTMNGTRRPANRTVELASGITATIRYSPAMSDSGPAGGVFRVRLARVVPFAGAAPAPLAYGHALPGLVGSGAAWTRCTQQAIACYEAGDWLAVRGETGVGKLALLQSTHRQRNPAGRWRVFEPPVDPSAPGETAAWLARVADEVGTPSTMLVIPHADRLDADAVAGLLDTLQETRDDGDPALRSRVAITLSTPPAGDAFEDLLPLFPRSIDVPALRHRPEDLADLVPYFLGQLSRHEPLVCSPGALTMLQRCAWPGNVSQLRRVLGGLARRRHGGVIGLDDLPPECRVVSRRVLTQIEALERDAIVQSLMDNARNVAQAARDLGMSRATIYRKIHNYGIRPATLQGSGPRG
jgi:sigma-54 dependent transcriptional regulator, acetoin dehydrogenase operon transcriptional activator AcoR